VSNRPVYITSVPLYALMTWGTTAWSVCSTCTKYLYSHIVQPISYSMQKLNMYTLGQKHVLTFILTHNDGQNCLFWHIMVKGHLLQVIHSFFFPDSKEIVQIANLCKLHCYYIFMKHIRGFLYQWCSNFCTCKFKHISNLTKMFMLLNTTGQGQFELLWHDFDASTSST